MFIYFISKLVIWLFDLGEINYEFRVLLAFLSAFEILFALTEIASADTERGKNG